MAETSSRCPFKEEIKLKTSITTREFRTDFLGRYDTNRARASRVEAKNLNYKTKCRVKNQVKMSFGTSFRFVSLISCGVAGRGVMMVPMVALEWGAIVLAPSGFKFQNRLSFSDGRPPDVVHGKKTIYMTCKT